MRVNRTGRLVGALVVAGTLLVAGCGSEDPDSKGDPRPVGPDTAGAAAAGKAAGEAMGAPVELERKKIGILQIIGSAESAAAGQRAVEDAAKEIGWETTVCDGQGDPVKLANCADTLLAAKVDAIVSIANEPAQYKAQLRKAGERGIPVITITGEVSPDPDMAAAYAPDNRKQGDVLAAWMMEKLTPLEGQKDISVSSFPSVWGKNRSEAVLAAIKADPSVKVTATFTTDPTNVQAGTRKTITDQLTENPGLKAIWFTYDVAAQSGGQAVQAKLPGKEFPDRPLVLTFGTDTGTLAMLRAGAISATVENLGEVNGWQAVDQLASHFANGTDIAPTTADFTTYGDFVFTEYRIFTKENIPASGPVQAPSDFKAFFAAKWDAQFS